MRLSFSLPFQRPDGTAPAAQEIGRRAALIEQIGFDGIFIGESIGRASSARPDVLMWLLAAAGATTHIELGTAILETPLRYPVELANRLMTMHALCGGRFTAGLGSGSTRADFEAVGVDFEQRFKLFNEGLPVIRSLLQGETVGSANLHPWPDAAGGPPIMIGSWHSGMWVTRAARNYDGWQGSALTSYNALKEGIQRFRDAGGKRAMVCTIDVALRAPRQPLGDEERFRLQCGPEEAAERLQRLAALGYDDACLVRMDHTEADVTEEDLRIMRSLVPRE